VGHIDAKADIVDLLCSLVNTPSVSGNEAALADEVQRELESCSWLQVTRVSNTVVARTQLGRERRVVVAGHLDTVPVANNDSALRVAAGGTLPTGERVDDDVVFGLGSCDMKGGVAVGLSTAVSVTAPVHDVTYIFYECEEVDSARNGLTVLAAQHPELLAGDAAVLLEPSNAAIEAGCQGTLVATVRAAGVRAHSARSWRGENAIHALLPALRVLADYQPRRVMVDGLEYREGMNAVRLAAGVANNVIPDEALLTVNYRYAPTTTPAEAEAHVRAVFSDFEVAIVDNAGGALPGLDRIGDLVALCDGNVAPKFGWTDVARFSAMGVPAVNMGPGDPSLAHARNEHVSISQVYRCREVLTAWLTGVSA
jgi:succinyl-diaminopimelate desuccinylase